MKIAIFGEQTGRGGHLAWTDAYRDYDESWDSSDDVRVFEGTEAELLMEALDMELRSQTADAGHDTYLLRCSRTIREQVA